MKTNEIVQILKNQKYRNGSYIKAMWIKDLTTDQGKEYGIKAEKITSCTIRLGINYSHTKFAKSRSQIASNVPKRSPWYKHTDIQYVVEHNTNGTQYLQCFTSPNKSKSRVEINGEIVTSDTYDMYVKMGLVQKQKPSSGECCVMTIPVENIRQLGDYYQQIR